MTQNNLLLWVLWYLKGCVALPTSSHTPPALQRESYTDLDSDEQSRACRVHATAMQGQGP